MNEPTKNSIAFIDIEVNPETKKITDIGGINQNQNVFHSPVIKDFTSFIDNCDFICGHNIINHDSKYLNLTNKKIIDTLYLSPLLFPQYPYHKLVKDDKIFTEELNNPLNDSIKAKNLFFDELSTYQELPVNIQKIYAFLLADIDEFRGFFEYLNIKNKNCDETFIKNTYKNKFCTNANLSDIIANYPVELAYALAIIGIENNDNPSITPAWVLKKYPKVEIIIKQLCNTPCNNMCSYCENHLNIHHQLKKYFNYTEFRKYDGEPLQEKACKAAVENKSLIAIFPTGGGKSLTFQLPALISGETIRGLTVVISPLQSLMKDQIDNLEKKEIIDAVTINGLLNPIERAEAINRVRNGLATILYISPEQLRSITIEHLLLSRNVVRVVIDEAHCFSAWGQDFRVDYLYIGDFIKKLQEKKGNNKIAISCFTATAKPKVIMDIKEYFKEKLDINLDIYASTATRENLHYEVRIEVTDEKKYNEMRALIEAKNCSTIVYVNSVKKTEELAERLTKDGFPALPYNGKMESRKKVETQEKFINDEINIIVATSAFGMGVDKQDIKLVIHYNAPNSLEDYMQESGRAAREQSLNADCYILFSPNDIDRHFIHLNQTKLTLNEIQQVWSAIKRLTRRRNKFCRSAIEIAREAGWDKAEINKQEIEIKVKTALLALEKAGYIKRGQNMPRIYATSINAKNVIDAEEKMQKSGLFNEEQQQLANVVISKLIASRSRAKAKNDDAESRIDWLADTIGVERQKIIEIINIMKQINLLADDGDMSAVINDSYQKLFDLYVKIEGHLINSDLKQKNIFSLKDLNENIQNVG
ncbi:MAG: RecQ family ATP-dependent DNA helicase, partial [Cyanobacteria bacterium RUI128]|nr:RecQ family ATP-dependent DNA helicase [Cyanobacteria bacterium RUI128]